MRYTRFISLMLLLLIAGSSVGCSWLTGKSKSDTLIPAPQSPIADVPIPAGFTMTADSTSKVVPGNSLRFVDHHYKGPDDLLPVVKFYKDQLTGKQWTLADQTQPNGNEVALHFTKNNEDCFVTIMQHTFDTTIQVRIDPTARNTAK